MTKISIQARNQTPSIRALLVLAALISLGAACTKKKKTEGSEKTSTVASQQNSASTASNTKAMQDSARKAATTTKSDGLREICFGKSGPTEALELSIGSLKYQRIGQTLRRVSEDIDDEFRLGHLSDIKDYNESNKANIDQFSKWFTENEVDAVVVTGDIGESTASIKSSLKQLAQMNVPILVFPGNRECADDYQRALSQLSAYPQVVDMTQVRLFDTDDMALVSLPGYYNHDYAHCDRGCTYTKDDLIALSTTLNSAKGKAKVIAAHGPPKMSGTHALDRVTDGGNVGDPALASWISNNRVPFGLFGNIQEAGGRATDLPGNTLRVEGTYADSVYVNAGPVDAMKWKMLDGSYAVGMAALLTIKGEQAKVSFKKL